MFSKVNGEQEDREKEALAQPDEADSGLENESDYEEDAEIAPNSPGQEGEESPPSPEDLWQAEREELLDRIKRKQADIDNLRRIGKLEQAEAREYALYQFLSQLLPVIDNLERALDASRQNPDLPASHREGLEMIYKQLTGVLQAEGVERIEAEGCRFDPNCHHAVLQEADPEGEPGNVLEELQKGYRYKKRILRPSMVKVCAE